MKKFFFQTTCLLVIMVTCIPIWPASAAPAAAINVTVNEAFIFFPESIEFSIRVRSDKEKITKIALEYGTDQLTCGNVIAKATPEITPGQQVSTAWTWNMLQSGSVPPGATIWWRWVITDESGATTTTETMIITWLDSEFDWRVISGDAINLYWYEGSQGFGQTLYNSAVQSLQRLDKEAGLQTDEPIDLYIYGNFDDLQNAILYESSWTGGRAFSEFNIVIIGISPDNLDYGKRTLTHELTHVLVGHLTFNCLWTMPQWLSEGLAVYSEGSLEDFSQKNFEEAIQSDALLTLRSLSGNFSAEADKADLSYSESYSVVNYLISAYGRDQIMALLFALRDGENLDQALLNIYGFDLIGLENAWRASIGAPLLPETANATATPPPTPVPTFMPISIPVVEASPTPTATLSVPTATPSPTASPAPERDLLKTGLIVGGACLAAVFIVIAVVIVFILRRRSNRSNTHEA